MKPTVFIGTLGTQPQVITLALDHLYSDYNCHFAEVCIIHTDNQTEPIKSTVKRLDNAFKTYNIVHQAPGDIMWEAVYAYHNTYFPYDTYEGTLNYRRVVIQRKVEQPGRLRKFAPVVDVETEDNSKATFQTIYRLVHEYKQLGATIHFSIAGGRKSMSVFGLAAAQIQFDYGDKLWHVVSTRELVQASTMHDKERLSKLVAVDLIHLGEYLSTQGVAYNDPYKIIEAQRTYLRGLQIPLKEKFLDLLSAVERQMMVGVSQLLTYEQIGSRLQPKERSVKTVSNTVSDIAKKYRVFCEEEGIVLRDGEPQQLLIAEFATYFQMKREQLG